MDQKMYLLQQLNKAENAIKAAKMQILNARSQADIEFSTVPMLEAKLLIQKAENIVPGTIFRK